MVQLLAVAPALRDRRPGSPYTRWCSSRSSRSRRSAAGGDRAATLGVAGVVFSPGPALERARHRGHRRPHPVRHARGPRGRRHGARDHRPAPGPQRRAAVAADGPGGAAGPRPRRRRRARTRGQPAARGPRPADLRDRLRHRAGHHRDRRHRHGRGVQRRRGASARVRAGRGRRTHAPDRLPRPSTSWRRAARCVLRRQPDRPPADPGRRARRAGARRAGRRCATGRTSRATGAG